jgi:hypothetical protein
MRRTLPLSTGPEYRGPLSSCEKEERAEEAIVDDQDLKARIDDLAREEHELFEREAQGDASDGDRERLKHIEVTLDQCWDLLRQRRARRSAGLDPNEAQVRDERTVEGYIG